MGLVLQRQQHPPQSGTESDQFRVQLRTTACSTYDVDDLRESDPERDVEGVAGVGERTQSRVVVTQQVAYQRVLVLVTQASYTRHRQTAAAAMSLPVTLHDSSNTAHFTRATLC